MVNKPSHEAEPTPPPVSTSKTLEQKVRQMKEALNLDPHADPLTALKEYRQEREDLDPAFELSSLIPLEEREYYIIFLKQLPVFLTVANHLVDSLEAAMEASNHLAALVYWELLDTMLNLPSMDQRTFVSHELFRDMSQEPNLLQAHEIFTGQMVIESFEAFMARLEALEPHRPTNISYRSQSDEALNLRDRRETLEAAKNKSAS